MFISVYITDFLLHRLLYFLLVITLTIKYIEKEVNVMEWIIEPNEIVDEAENTTCWCISHCPTHYCSCPDKSICYCSMTSYGGCY